jgi:hypothetical protein
VFSALSSLPEARKWIRAIDGEAEQVQLLRDSLLFRIHSPALVLLSPRIATDQGFRSSGDLIRSDPKDLARQIRSDPSVPVLVSASQSGRRKERERKRDVLASVWPLEVPIQQGRISRPNPGGGQGWENGEKSFAVFETLI